MIIIRILGWLWCLPVSLVGLLVVPFCAPRRVRFRWLGWHGVRGIIEFDAGRWLRGYAAATFGVVQLYRDGLDNAERQRHRKHEDAHTLQGFWLGLFDAVYFVFAGVLWVYWYIRTKGKFAATMAYWHNPLEAHARKLAGEDE